MTDTREPQLSGILAEIEAAADRTTALLVGEKLGGQRRYVPSPDQVEDSSLAKEVGVPAACVLAKLRAGENIDFPRCRSALVHNLVIVEGVSLNEAARRAAMDRRSVQRLVTSLRDDARQMQLFDAS